MEVGSRVKDKDGNTYLLTEELGHGGFGCVYKAVRDSDKAIYAVKTLLYSFANEEAVNSFKNEIILSGKISGENVIHYVYAHDGEAYPELPPYIIMEYANGGTLKDRISKRKANNTPFSREELMSIYKQLIDGMIAINAELVHRDIKPENILVSNDVLKISDFGLAKIASESTRTMSFKGYGTIPYIAPEAWNSDKNTIQMDIYSMGIVFYELATLPNFSCHSLRHTFTTRLVEAGVNIKVIQELFGYIRSDVILDIYTTVTKELKQCEFSNFEGKLKQ